MLRKIQENLKTSIPENSLDFIRLVFAIDVAILHFASLSDWSSLDGLATALMGRVVILGFFIISGMLLCASLLRSKTLGDYFKKRAFRLYPGYILMLAILALGLFFFSSSNASEYFGSSHFLKYLASNFFFLNFLEPTLPGVFTQAPVESAVNGSLWTIKVEVIFYFFLPVFLWLLSFVKSLKWKNIILLLAYIFSFIYIYFVRNSPAVPDAYRGILTYQFPGLMNFFIVGMFLYFNFAWIQKNIKWLAVLSLIAFFERWVFETMYLVPLAFGFLIFFVGFSFPQLNKITRNNDYSYGIYIYHFPVAQLIWTSALPTYNLLLSFVIFAVVVFALAYFSWHFVEKPFIKRRKQKVPQQ